MDLEITRTALNMTGNITAPGTINIGGNLLSNLQYLLKKNSGMMYSTMIVWEQRPRPHHEGATVNVQS